MRSYRTRSAILVALVASLMVGGLAYSVAHSQARARATQESEFGRRAALAARLTGAALSSDGGGASARQQFSGPASSLAKATASWEQMGPANQRVALFDRGRHVLATWPAGTERSVSRLVPGGALRDAAIGRLLISDIVQWGPRRVPLVWVLETFQTPYGERILASLSSPGQVSSFADPYLKSAPAVPGAKAYVIDGARRILASSTGLPQGSAVPERGLGNALGRGRAGNLGRLYWVQSPPLDGTDWRVVFVASRSTILGPADSSSELAWLLFSAFVLAVLALIAVGVWMIQHSAQYASAQERDNSARKLAHERLHDRSTRLPNRALFIDRTEYALARAERTEQSVAVLFADVDNFRRINDSLGHHAGDILLRKVAGRLQEAVHRPDTVSRFGGDQFLILCDEIADDHEALRVAGQLHSALDRPFRLGPRAVHLTCSIGISIHRPGDPPIDAEALVRDANAAVYSAKSAGGRRLKLFDTELQAGALRRLDTEAALRVGIANNQLSVSYQPIVALRQEAMWGVEALARWFRPNIGRVPPAEFIPLAEECGLIEQVGEIVLKTAMSDVRDWAERGLLPEGFLLSVNVSPLQLAGSEFPVLVERELDSWPLAPSSLCLEITESAVAMDARAAERTLGRLGELGVKVAIDDFGTGLSSLKQLATSSLAVDVIKLDQSFVAQIAHPRQHAVVAAVAPMASQLGMIAVAEGVEEPEQAQEVMNLGYPLAQGYFFGRPTGAAEITALLTTERRSRPSKDSPSQMRTAS
jgi:diguanylate cyclase (GGDEF)-like protein